MSAHSPGWGLRSREGMRQGGSHSAGSPPVTRADLGVVLGPLPLVGLLAVQAAIGYEWFMSGLTKVVRGGAPGRAGGRAAG